ncbi:MAG: prepilin-type N-terminal cleavage/methylation domain-containing protein [Phycisphaeraceae bacterium]
MKRKRTGFTLIELLVVISIIALLIGILLPSLSSARKLAKAMSGLSNIRQTYIGMAAYAADNNGWLPYRPPTSNYLPHRMNVSGHYDLQKSFIGPYLGSSRDQLMFCVGDLYEERNPESNGYDYNLVTVQYLNMVLPSSTPYVQANGIYDLTRIDNPGTSDKPVWGCLTIEISSGLFLGHDAPFSQAPPTGSNFVFMDGSGRWTSWGDHEPYLISSTIYYRPKTSDN